MERNEINICRWFFSRSNPIFPRSCILNTVTPREQYCICESNKSFSCTELFSILMCRGRDQCFQYLHLLSYKTIKTLKKISLHCIFNVQKAGAAGLKYSMEYERVYSPTDGVISHYEGLHPVKVRDTQEKD